MVIIQFTRHAMCSLRYVIARY